MTSVTGKIKVTLQTVTPQTEYASQLLQQAEGDFKVKIDVATT